MWADPSGGVDQGADGCSLASCWEPANETTATHWSYVGRGRGDFEPMRTYGYVGRGGGSFQKETVTTQQGWRLKPWCFAVFAFIGLTGCVHIYTRPRVAGPSGAKLAPAREAIQQPHAAAPREPIVRPRFLCAAPPLPGGSIADGAAGEHISGPAALIGAAIVEAAWSVADTDGDGAVDGRELDMCDHVKCVSTRGIWLLRSAAKASGGRLRRSAFAATLARAGLLASPAPHSLADAIATSASEAAWIAASSSEDESVSLGELATLLVAARPASPVQGTALLTPREQELLVEADDDKDGRLDRTEFQAGISRAGLALFVADESARSIIGAIAGEVLWNAADIGRDGRLGWMELNGLQQRHSLARSLQLPQLAAEGSGLLHDDFVEMVAQDGLGSELVRILTAKAPVASGAANSSWALAMLAPVHSWSTPKKNWCCENVGLGCTWTPETLPYDCKDMPAEPQEAWPEGRRAWCCQHGAAGPGCDTTVAQAPIQQPAFLPAAAPAAVPAPAASALPDAGAGGVQYT